MDILKWQRKLARSSALAFKYSGMIYSFKPIWTIKNNCIHLNQYKWQGHSAWRSISRTIKLLIPVYQILQAYILKYKKM